MDVVFSANKLIKVSRTGSVLMALEEADYGDAILAFCNHFYSWTQDGTRNLFFGLTAEEQERAVDAFPICSAFRASPQQVINYYNTLTAALTITDPAGSDEVKLLCAAILNDEDAPDTPEKIEPRQFTTYFSLLNGKVVPVYEVNTLHEYLALDFYYTMFCLEQHRIAICPWCHKAFRQSKIDQIYCSKGCQENANTARHRKNPYYKKYRSLLQRYSRLGHKLEHSPAYIATYERWTREAAQAYKETAQKWEEKESQANQEILNKVFPEKALPIIQISLPTETEFAAILKNRWDDIMAEEQTDKS